MVSWPEEKETRDCTMSFLKISAKANIELVDIIQQQIQF